MKRKNHFAEKGRFIPAMDIEQRIDQLKRKDVLLTFLSFSVLFLALEKNNKWFKLPFIIVDILLIVNTIIEMVQEINNKTNGGKQK